MFRLFVTTAMCLFTVPVMAADCDDCTVEEKTTLKLHQLKDTVGLLKDIQDELVDIPPSASRLYLSSYATKEEVDALLGPLKETKPKAVVAAPVKKAKVTKKVAKRTKGYDQMLVAHAQAARPEIGFSASAIIVSEGRPNPLGIGNKFTHLGQGYELKSVTEYENEDGTVGVAVTVINAKSGETINIPWNLNAE